MTFKGVIPGVEANCTGSVTLEVVFRSPDNFRSEELILDIVPFRVVITHCSGKPHSLSSMWYRTTHTSSSRCQALEESLQSMETSNALSERRGIRRPSRRKYKVAFQGNSPVRLLNVRTPSSAPGVTYNKTSWHVPSRRSNAASTPALTKMRHQYFAYITTL